MGTENKARWMRWESKYKTGYKRIDEQHKDYLKLQAKAYAQKMQMYGNKEQK